MAGLCVALLCQQLVGGSLCQPVQAQEQVVHVVQAGENLFRLAIRYGTTVEAIVTANNLADGDSITVGQQLIIPGATSGSTSTGPAATTGCTYVVQHGDTLIGISLRYGVRLQDLLKVNGLYADKFIYAGQTLAIPSGAGSAPEPGPATGGRYIVQPGDTLSAIAARYDTTAFALARVNGIANPSLIRVGQVLKVSGPGITPPVLKRIVIDLSEQHLYAYDDDRLIFSFVASSGKAPYYTRTGQFQVQSKIPNAYGSKWDIWMPHWLGIYWAGGTENGIHALPIMSNGQTLWAGYLGSPVSYGCIVLGTNDAKRLYDWVEIGTPVSIRS
jgi:LysM repeat protein